MCWKHPLDIIHDENVASMRPININKASSRETDRTSKIFRDNCKVSLKPYAIFRPIEMQEFKSSWGLNF